MGKRMFLEDEKRRPYLKRGLILFAVYTFGTFLTLLLVFKAAPRLAAVVLSLWGIATLFPATVLISLGLIFASDQGLDKCIHRKVNFIRHYGLFVSLMVSFLAIMILIEFVFFASPFTIDEEAYLFQAKTYLLGRIVMPVPPAAESINIFFMIINWIWTTRYLWGHPVLLSVGMLVGSPYVATVLMALSSLVLLYLIGIRTASKEEATIAVFLMGTSPWFWFISGTLLSSVSMLFLLLLFIYGWLRLQDRPRVLLGTALGLCLGWAFTVRPLTAVCFGLPFAIMAIHKVWNEPRRWLPAIVGLLSGWSAIMIMVIIYNTLVTGDPFTFPYLYYNNGAERLGFGERASGTFTPFTALLNLGKSVFLVNMWLFGWPISLLPVIGLVSGHLIYRLGGNSGLGHWLTFFSSRNSWDTVWISIIFSVSCGYFFFCWSLLIVTIPIYYYELLIPLCLLSAKGLMNFHTLFSSISSRWRLFVPVFCTVSLISSVLFFVPVRAANTRDRIFTIPIEVNAAHKLTDKKALIFVDLREPDLRPIPPLPYPSPRLDDQLLFLFFRDDETNELAMRAFSDRIPYLMKSCDRQYRPQAVIRLPIDEPPSDPDIITSARVKLYYGKIDRSQPPPATAYLLKLLGLHQD